MSAPPPAPPAPPDAHTTLHGGRYVLLGPLGTGSQGTTWDAVDRREGRAVAVKRFDVRGATAWKDVELAEREARVVATLDYPTLPRYVEHFEEGGALYLVMEKIEGVPLSELKGKMTDADVMRLLRDADRALAYLHGRSPPVFHRDLKPSNVIRRPDGSFAFVDFGAVRERLRPQGGSTVVGTFGYMAPEQFQGRAGPGSDVYAIGATAMAILTGSEPEELPHRGLAIDVDSALGGRSHGGLRDVLRRMLEVDPDARPTRIGSLLDRDGVPAFSENFGRSFERDIRDDIERRVRRHVERATRRADRRARREERRAQERARRHVERDALREAYGGYGQRRGSPWFIWLFVLIGLVVAQLAVTVAIRIAVPVVLVVLSFVFGRKLRSAARSVARAGERAQEAMTEAMHHVGGAAGEEGGARARVAEEAHEERRPGPVRVDTPEAWADDEAGREEEELDEEAPRTRGR
ncbi:MAG TPA: serine/threonine-protein kinase [Polyangiaceae bacterium]|nr:serine/threonine-protein kinase [Polyangiaceae bacterium]